MKRLLILVCLASPVFGQYASHATLTLPGATATQTNISIPFSFNAAALKTVANGGQIRNNTCSRNGYTVPCDFVFTDQPGCGASVTAYKWGIEGDYSATAGTGHGWLLIPSYTTSPLTVYVCIGNSAITTYQGGAVGAEFDSNTVAVYHLANGTTLSGVDFSKNLNAGTLAGTAPTAVAGEIDGAASFGGAGIITLAHTAGLPFYNTTGYTVSEWLNGASTASNGYTFAEGANSATTTLFGLEANYSGGMGFAGKMRVFIRNEAGTTILDQESTTSALTGAWNQVVWSDNGGTSPALYVNGAADATSFVYTPSGTWTGTADSIGGVQRTTNTGFFTGSIDEVRIDSVARSASWVATVYAAEANVAAIGPFRGFGFPAVY